MTDIFQVNSVQPDATARTAQQMAQAAAAAQQETNLDVIEKGQAVRKIEDQEQEAKPKTETQPNNLAKPKVMDVYLKFQVDEQDELTIFVLDKETQKIIRSIPPADLTKMSAGELIELFV